MKEFNNYSKIKIFLLLYTFLRNYTVEMASASQIGDLRLGETLYVASVTDGRLGRNRTNVRGVSGRAGELRVR